MAASYTIVSPIEGINGATFAVVADESTARYVFPEGVTPYFGDDRVQELVSLTGRTPTSPTGWINLALSNMSYSRPGPPVAADDIEGATAAAQSELAAQ